MQAPLPSLHGTVRWDARAQRWRVRCSPHVMIRFKRVFERVAKYEYGEVRLADTPENCRDLVWFLERFPMEVEDEDRLILAATRYDRRMESIKHITSPDYRAPHVELAVPLRDYQKIPASLVLAKGGTLCADDVGLGKTAEAIALFASPESLPALVVTLTHLPRQWEAEVRRFAPALSVHVIAKGSPQGRRMRRGEWEREAQDLAALIEAGHDLPDVTIASYSKLAKWAELLGGKYNTVVFDEAQELRHDRTERYEAAKHVARQARFRLGLSATPIYNYGAEMFNVVDIVCPDELGDWHEFLREWSDGEAGGRPKINDPAAFGTYLREHGMMLRRTKTEVGRELPAIQLVPHIIDADDAAIDSVAGEQAASLARLILTRDARGFDRFAAGGQYDHMMRQLTGLGKAPSVAAFVRMLLESEERVVLYGWHHEVYRIWRDALAEFSPVFYTGTETEAQKLESKRRFIDGESRLLIVSLRAGAGLDGLQHVARIVVFGELDWSPGVHNQCIGRLARDGQTGHVVAYFLYANSGADPTMIDVLGVKRGQIDGMLDPDAPFAQALAQSGNHVRKLAEDFLRRRGEQLPSDTQRLIDSLRRAGPAA